MGAMSVCAVIPCDPRHASVAREAVDSILMQTWPVRTVVVRFSSMRRCPSRRANLPNVSNLFVNCTTARETLGVVRDEAVKQCRDEDYITYLDSDDVALPYAVERMLKLMRQNNATVGLHDYFPKWNNLVVRNHTQLKPHFRERNPPFSLNVHHAHATIRRKSLVLHHNITVGEDSWLMRDLWNRNETFVYTAEKLTVYIDRKIKSRVTGKAPRPHRRQRGFFERISDAGKALFGSYR